MVAAAGSSVGGVGDGGGGDIFFVAIGHHMRGGETVLGGREGEDFVFSFGTHALTITARTRIRANFQTTHEHLKIYLFEKLAERMGGTGGGGARTLKRRACGVWGQKKRRDLKTFLHIY